MPRTHPDPQTLAHIRRRDPSLARAMDRVPPYPGFPNGARARGTHFQQICHAIVYQQLTGKAAGTIHARVVALTPGPRFPTPSECLALPDEAFRGAGMSRAKTRSVKDLAERVLAGRVRLRAIGRRPDAEVIEELTQVWGIGEWSAQMFLMFRLGRLDVMPSADLGVQEGLRRLDALDRRPSPAEVLQRAETWRPLRSVAAWVLWRLTDMEL